MLQKYNLKIQNTKWSDYGRINIYAWKDKYLIVNHWGRQEFSKAAFRSHNLKKKRHYAGPKNKVETFAKHDEYGNSLQKGRTIRTGDILG